jgi:hypothetical protein
MLEDKRTCIYSIALNDTIAQVNAEWLAFAGENGFDRTLGEGVIGKSLWLFIESDVVRHLYQMVFERIRKGQGIHGVPYRCDAPDCRRFMQMDLKKTADLNVQLKIVSSGRSSAIRCRF